MKKILYAFACAALLLAGCQSPKKLELDTDPDPMNYVQVTVPSEKIPAEGGSLDVAVISDIPYSVSVSQKDLAWLTASQTASGVTFTATANSSAVLRYASVALLNEDNYAIKRFDITQEGTDVEPKAFAVEKEAISVRAGETTTSFNVMADSDVAWTVLSDQPSFVPTPASGNGNGTITVTFPVNATSNPVVANLIVATKTVPVKKNSYTVVLTQEGAKVPVKPAPGVLAEWHFKIDNTNTLNVHFNEEYATATLTPGNGGLYVEPNVQGKGRIEYYYDVDKTALLEGGDGKGCRRWIGSYGEVCVNGSWPGDYVLWTAEADAPLAAGTKLHIIYTIRPNNNEVMKYWKLEYLDGTTWKLAKEAKQIGDITYTEEFFYTAGSGKQTNSTVEATVTLSADTEVAQFKMTCVKNAAAGDGTEVQKLAGGYTLRFAGEDCNDKTPHYSVTQHPLIEVVE